MGGGVMMLPLPFAYPPMPTVLRKRDGWSVVELEHFTAVGMLKRLHYAKGCANTSSLAAGLRTPCRRVVGVALWMTPVAGVQGWAERLGARQPIVLSRMVIEDEVPRNGASFLLARSLRLLQRQGWDFAVTYADPVFGHDGHVYVASGWTRMGFGEPRAIWRDQEGRQRSRKAGPRTLTVAECEAKGWTRTPGEPRPRFIRWLA